MSSEEVVKIEAFKHHIRSKICNTRSEYRRGRRETAVKVFTISDESKYLLIHKVPDIKVNIKEELFRLCQRFGQIEKLCLIDYPNCEQFTKVYLVKYKKFVNAVMAKKSLDDKNFLGSILHVCYAPELESIHETKEKLNDRKRYVTKILEQTDRNHELKTEKSVLGGCSQSHTISNESNVNSQTKSNRLPAFSDRNQLETNVETVAEEDIVNKTDTLKRKLPQIDSYCDARLNVKSNMSKLSCDVPPKIRWRK